MSVSKFPAGGKFPAYRWPRVGGGTVSPADVPGWRLVVVYRGRHCPLCTRYLVHLDELLKGDDLGGLSVWALSCDPQERAAAHVAEGGWTLTTLTDLSEDQMRELGLYISKPRSAEETDRPFAEPALFVINPAGAVQVVNVSNAPFSRPDPKSFLDGVRFIMSRDYPIRGTL